MRLLGIAIILLACMLLSACVRTQYVPVETTRIDSISVRDTVVEKLLVPYKDSIVTEDTVSSLSNPYAYSRAEWRDGHLYHTLGIYPTSKVYIKVPYYIDRYRYRESPKIVEVEKELTEWEEFLHFLGPFVMGAVAGFFSCFLVRI